MSSIEVRNLCKQYGHNHVVNDVSFTVKKESFTVLLGPSGCGKSTTLRMIAGLEEPTSGEVWIDGKNVTQKPPSKRALSMVFQSYALFPHMSVEENIIFGLKIRGVCAHERSMRLKKVTKLVELESYLKRKPSELSGGQKQRVALARAIIAEQRICLMDEPLSNLDAKLRHEMRVEIRALQQRLGMSVLYVTHDQVEAMSMADQIILLNDGKIEQKGVPTDFYTYPNSLFVGRFIGTPPMNILPTEQIQHLPIFNCIPFFHSHSNSISTQSWYVGIRPEDITVSETAQGCEAEVVFTDYHGADTILGITLGGDATNNPILCRVQGYCSYKNGDRIWVTWRDDKITVFDSQGKRKPYAS